MKTNRIIVIVMIMAAALAAITWVRGDSEWHVIQVLPLCGGAEPHVHDFAGALLVIIAVAGACRMWRKHDQ